MWKVGSVVCWFRELINIPELLDPSSQEVISHGDTLLIDTNPRMRLAFEEETRTSTLTVDEISIYIYTCFYRLQFCLFTDRQSSGGRRWHFPVPSQHQRRRCAQLAHRSGIEGTLSMHLFYNWMTKLNPKLIFPGGNRPSFNIWHAQQNHGRSFQLSAPPLCDAPGDSFFFSQLICARSFLFLLLLVLLYVYVSAVLCVW